MAIPFVRTASLCAALMWVVSQSAWAVTEIPFWHAMEGERHCCK